MNDSVVIIGLANAGKSTLFNALCGKKRAIVSKIAGTTRDWNSAPANLGGLKFDIIDTLGISERKFDERLVELVEQAKAVIFLVDGQNPLSPHSVAMVNLWRKKVNTPFVAVANKCEGKKGFPEDCWQLGLGEPVAISAAHRVGFGELYEALAPHIKPDMKPDIKPTEESELGKMPKSKTSDKTKLQKGSKQQATEPTEQTTDPNPPQPPKAKTPADSKTPQPPQKSDASVGSDATPPKAKTPADSKTPQPPKAKTSTETPANPRKGGEEQEPSEAEEATAPAEQQGFEPAEQQSSEPTEPQGFESPEATKRQGLRLVLLGSPNVGKSSLANHLAHKNRMAIAAEAGTTTDSVMIPFERDGVKFELVDTAGIAKRKTLRAKRSLLAALSVSQSLRALRLAEVAVVMFEPFRSPTNDVKLMELARKEGRAIVAVLNKCDTLASPKHQLNQLAKRLEKARFFNYKPIGCSAKTGIGCDEILTQAVAAAQLWRKRIATSPLNRWVGGAVEAHPPPLYKGKRLKVKFVSQIKTAPPTFLVSVSNASKFPKSYVNYLESHLRRSFEFGATPLRFIVKDSVKDLVKDRVKDRAKDLVKNRTKDSAKSSAKNTVKSSGA